MFATEKIFLKEQRCDKEKDECKRLEISVSAAVNICFFFYDKIILECKQSAKSPIEPKFFVWQNPPLTALCHIRSPIPIFI